jgi:hypothetical protein
MRPRIDIFTVASIGIFAFGLEPVIHEVLGHVVVCWLTGGKVILISSTAMQTSSASRLVPAAGPLANILFGLAALALLRSLTTQQIAIVPARTDARGDANLGDGRGLRVGNSAAIELGTSGTDPEAAAHGPGGATRISLTRLFLYFFAFANLFLAFGYILYSGLINFGDLAAVIAGLRPAWLYRAALVIIGALGYRYGIAQAARCLAQLLARANANTPPAFATHASPPPALPLHSTPQQSPPLTAASISLPAARRITHTACFAGGALFLLSSCLNPISPSLILYDGLSGTIGLTLGFFLALTDLRQSAAQRAVKSPAAASTSQTSAPQFAAPTLELPFNLPLTVTAAIFAAAFLLFMGHGIRLP